jgi:hypothetical protein
VFAPGTRTRVLTSLEVRSGPGADWSLLKPAEWIAEGVTLHDTLSAGDLLTIVHGPFWIRGMPWYHVAESPPYSAWVDASQPDTGRWGWVAAADAAGNRYLGDEETHDAPSHDLVATGNGDGLTEVVPAGESQGLNWVAAADSSTDDCRLMLKPEATGQVVADERVEGYRDGGFWWPESVTSAVRVESDCAWYVQVRHGVQGRR